MVKKAPTKPNKEGTTAKEAVEVAEQHGLAPEPRSSNVVELFRAKCETAMSKIQKLDEFRASDPMVDFVFKVGRELFETPLDRQTPDRLLHYGGKLVGAYPYLGQKSSYARAERDVYENKLKEVEKELFLNYVDGKYKVTEIKARISAEVSIVSEFVLQKEAEKNQWENMTEACQAMFSFCQSALRVKEGEKFSSNRMHNNG